MLTAGVAGGVLAPVTGARGRARATGSAATALSGVDAVLAGPFRMTAHVTAAVGVPGEHAGQVLTRIWAFFPLRCAPAYCTVLRLRRDRAGGRHAWITLRRTGAGRYAGTSSFFVALRCRQRVYPHGSRVPYTLRVDITAVTPAGPSAHAQQIAATYVNLSRTDATRCPLPPSHDAASYTGVSEVVPPYPAPPAGSLASGT